ncbi:MAG TPA: hypothetical protein VLV83_13800 [Acidobacteriota bacterium]|nr:hypothetical protein [Acidobacteriota bacterium]
MKYLSSALETKTRPALCGLLLWMALAAAAPPAWAGGGGGGDVPEPEFWGASHPLERIDPHGRRARVAVRDVPIRIEYPVLAGEEVVLSAVGTERQVDGVWEFRPLVAFLVDRSLSGEEGDGQWLAVWNLGQNTPGALSWFRAAIPGFTARKRSPSGQLNDLREKLETFNRAWDKGDIRIPDTTYEIIDGHQRSNVSLVLNGIKQGLSIADFSFLGQFLYRGMLLRRDDAQNRNFQQTYVGLLWYGDVARTTPDREPLSPDAIHEIKFRLLSNRHMLGRWVLPEAEQSFVHGFENEMRDHLWGTSCRLASDANEYGLGYEELQRYTASGVPMALGGILYYDPSIAPEQPPVEWGIDNPFDLTYDPFTEPEVQEAARRGERVPLAVYVYQSNMALKPIIVVDFFRPSNPRLREAATYWRKLGGEALGASNLGRLYKWGHQALGFAANRKGITLLSDMKLALGIEEFRLSLMNQMYFQADMADELLDQVDRLTINPLVQPGRVKRLQAQLDYQALLADGGELALLAARRIRNRRIFDALDIKPRPLDEDDYARYRIYLEQGRHIERLNLYLQEPYQSSVPIGEVEESLRALGDLSSGRDQEAAETLVRFRMEVGKLRDARGGGQQRLRQALSLSRDSLQRLYAVRGLSPDDLQSDLAAMEERVERQAEERHRQRQKDHANFFMQQMDSHLDYLQALVDSQGDLTHVSPWYVSRAADFFHQVPQVIASNPMAAKKFRKKEAQVASLLRQSEEKLAQARLSQQPQWLEEERQTCLDDLRGVQRHLRASIWEDGDFPLDGPQEKAPQRAARSAEPDIQ